LLGLLILGVILIILNYVQVLPGSPTNWYTLVGLICILSGAMLATRYR
jgi:LPXTG-motif cell wall-anchored protein